MSEKNMSDSKCKLMAFLFSIVLNGLTFIRGIDVQIISDGIGAFATAPFLAGLDWSWVVSRAKYYGFGYYWIFAPLLKITDNYLVLFLIIVAINFITCCSISVLIYHIMTREMGVPGGWLTIVVAAVCTTFRHNTFDLANEYPVFIMVWIICFVIIRLYNTKNDIKRNTKQTVILAVCCTYALMLHERITALWIAIVISIIIFRLRFKISFLNEKICIPLLLGGFLLQRIIRRMVVEKLWLLENGEKISNMTAVSAKQLGFVKSWGTIRTTFDCIVTNLYKLVCSSYGVAVVAILIVLVGLFSTRNTEIADVIHKVEKQYLILLVYGTTILITITGLATKGSALIWEGYQTGIPTSGYKHFFYLRYYLPYIGPAFAATYAIIYEYSGMLKKYIKSTASILLILFAYLCWMVFPKLKGTSYFGLRANLSPIMTNWLGNIDSYEIQILNVIISFFLVFVFLYTAFYYDKKMCKRLWILLILLTHIRNASLIWNANVWQFSCSRANGAYEFIQKLENDVKLPDKLYCLGDVFTYQFVLNQYSIIGEMPNDYTESVILFAQEDICGQEAVTGYYYAQLDENEWVYVRGDELVAKISENYNLVSCQE